MIGQLPETLANRSISIVLQRRRSDEPVESFRIDRTDHLDMLASQAARWATDNAERIQAADPEMPGGLFNRPADNWRALLAVADAAGGRWPGHARAACSALASIVDDSQSVAVLALGDIHSIFVARDVDRIMSADLVEAMAAIEGQPWAEWKGGKAITVNGLARLLKRLGIHPEPIWADGRTVRGYALVQFQDAFTRYLPENRVLNRKGARNVDKSGTSCTFQSARPSPALRFENAEKPNNDAIPCALAVQIGGAPEKGDDGASRNDEIPFGPPMHCEFCGKPPAAGNPVRICAVNGHGAWVHQSCQTPWADWLEPARK
jgi:hypothetical protein